MGATGGVNGGSSPIFQGTEAQKPTEKTQTLKGNDRKVVRAAKQHLRILNKAYGEVHDLKTQLQNFKVTVFSKTHLTGTIKSIFNGAIFRSKEKGHTSKEAEYLKKHIKYNSEQNKFAVQEAKAKFTPEQKEAYKKFERSVQEFKNTIGADQNEKLSTILLNAGAKPLDKAPAKEGDFKLGYTQVTIPSWQIERKDTAVFKREGGEITGHDTLQEKVTAKLVFNDYYLPAKPISQQDEAKSRQIEEQSDELSVVLDNPDIKFEEAPQAKAGEVKESSGRKKEVIEAAKKLAADLDGLLEGLKEHEVKVLKEHQE